MALNQELTHILLKRLKGEHTDQIVWYNNSRYE